MPCGVHKFYESMILRTATHYAYLDRVKLCLENAMARQAVFHLWFHPSDPLSVAERELLPIIQHLDSKRREGSVWVATMAEIASYCEARHTLKLDVQRIDSGLTVRWRGSFASERYGHTELTLVFPPLPRPRTITLRTGSESRDLPAAPSYDQRTAGRLVINMPTTASSLHILF
jgi:hypothetical protein